MLGKELRELRERKKKYAEETTTPDGGVDSYTAEAVSTKLGFSRSKLSRVEAGEIPLPKLADLEALMDEYDVIEPSDRDVLLQMQRDSLKSEPLTTFRNVLPSGMPRYLGLERESVRIRGFENNVVHGLLQDEKYASALMGSAKVVEERTTDAVERSVLARMERKKLLEGDREVHIILTENTLRTKIGSPEVMRAQYAEIIRLCEQDNVEVQIIPEDLSTYRAGFSFTVLEFDELDAVVQSDGYRSITMWSKPSDVGQYQRQFDAMVKAAPGPSQTPSFLMELEEKLWK
ncbi:MULTISPECIES: helix-turn-helix transcriptional regulator [unclassified Streptomyces]|uniref:helix-turn-helix domain-containing protein n=1 Tax=unclassified Streptomyces TaxID=2593676 RepID=UPI001BE897A5|nr:MULTISPECIES: helix-turn-helix transcriptional regulator [unclassified Streptomyces]MBT2405584.1 helix-turn-helix domain-containing protein [Streptomyces sp. ISL-21]MBT2607736.1 helix-turn-helix domain-containing protein [Streptomyces sp. ISL-87]